MPALTFPRLSRSTPRPSSRPSCSGLVKPTAIRTRSVSMANSLPSTPTSVRDDSPVTSRAIEAGHLAVGPLHAEDLAAEAALAALLERVGRDEPARLDRPGRVRVAAAARGPRDRRRAAARRSAPSRSALETQSMPVSPPPITTTRLPAAVICALGVLGDASLRLGDPAVAAVEVLHREVDAVEVATGDVEVALHPRAGRDHDRVVLAAQTLDARGRGRRRRRR